MKDCQGDLLGRVRRGLASGQERTAFEAHLVSCESCRMTLDLMGDFDAVGKAEPGDSELVARIAATAARTRGVIPPTPLRPTRRYRRLGVAALVLAGTAAAAGLGLVAFRSATKEDSPAVQNAAHQPSPKREAAAVAPALSAVPETAPNADTAPTADAASSRPKAASAPVAPVSATDMYRTANDARRAGRTGQAIRGYRDLQQRFPESAEARASRVSLGGLLLRGGSASDALAQFDTYLSGGGQLAAEALFGRGRALEALGRSAEEAQSMELLLRQYPNSPYATHAKRRLDELR